MKAAEQLVTYVATLPPEEKRALSALVALHEKHGAHLIGRALASGSVRLFIVAAALSDDPGPRILAQLDTGAALVTPRGPTDPRRRR